MNNYDPNTLWNEQFKDEFSLRIVGRNNFSLHFNMEYKIRARAMDRMILKHHIDINNKKVLDVGCGTGFWTDYYSHKKPKSIAGIDISEESPKHLKIMYPEYTFIHADISSNKIKESIKEKFDIINAVDILFHIVDDEKFFVAIENIKNMMKEDGIFIFTDQINCPDSCSHVKFRGLNYYQAHGLKIIDVQPIYRVMGNINYPIPPKYMNYISGVLYTIDVMCSLLNVLDRNNVCLIMAKLVNEGGKENVLA